MSSVFKLRKITKKWEKQMKNINPQISKFYHSAFPRQFLFPSLALYKEKTNNFIPTFKSNIFEFSC